MYHHSQVTALLLSRHSTLQPGLNKTKFSWNRVKCHCSTVKLFIMILHSIANMNKAWNSQQTPHSSELWGVCCEFQACLLWRCWRKLTSTLYIQQTPYSSPVRVRWVPSLINEHCIAVSTTVFYWNILNGTWLCITMISIALKGFYIWFHSFLSDILLTVTSILNYPCPE